VFAADGNLPLAHDPKVAWALAHPERFPVEVRTAPVEELVRVPGIGPESARKLAGNREVRNLQDLRRLGVVTGRAAGFITLGGRRLTRERWGEQLAFWRAEEEVGVRERVYEVSPGTFR
jgi:predicted DNA-binding helix-hairpin-helix protein